MLQAVFRFMLLLLLACAVGPFMAAPALADACTPTPALPVQHYPGETSIPHGNNLVQPAGKAVAAEGQQVVLYGQLLDPHCLPIADAVVEIWQVDPYGRWLLATPGDLVTPTAVFAGAGRAHTDAQGRFQFITLFPDALPGRAPHINIRVSLSGKKPFSTVLYFADDGRNATDGALKKLPAEQQARLQMLVGEAGKQGLGVSATLVMSYAAPYQRY